MLNGSNLTSARHQISKFRSSVITGACAPRSRGILHRSKRRQRRENGVRVPSFPSFPSVPISAFCFARCQ